MSASSSRDASAVGLLTSARWLARSDIATLRAAWWTYRAVRHVRRDLAVAGSLASVLVPPTLPIRAGSGMLAVLAKMQPSCLEESLVVQSWMTAHGDRREVVIGVARTDRITAHAWVDGSDDESPAIYDELYRLPAR
jgi:Transglutaminase-like superfamily